MILADKGFLAKGPGRSIAASQLHNYTSLISVWCRVLLQHHTAGDRLFGMPKSFSGMGADEDLEHYKLAAVIAGFAGFYRPTTASC